MARIIGIMAVVLLAGNSAFGEFMVQPIMLRQAVRPGRMVPLELNLENIGGDTTEFISLRLAELTQDENGVWTEVLTDDPNNTVDVSSLQSCKSWLTCGVDTVQLDPHQIAPVPLIARVPPGTRGYYFAALIAQTAPRETDIDGYTSMMSVQYLVPIILEVQGSTVRAQVKLTGVHLTYKPATIEEPAAAVIASLDIENTGGTYSRLQGQIRIWHQARGRWQKTADLTLPDNGIIPGVKLNLKQDLGVLLPDGQYKVEGYLYVDGSRGNGIFEEIDFKGDPRTSTVKMLVPIDLDKENLFVDATPGSTRGASVRVGNASEERIKVNAEIILPEHMLHVAMGSIRGEDLGCAKWVTLQPEEFELDKYRQRNLNLIIRMPDTATQYSNYYATLRLHVTYPDGSSGGTKIAQVCLRNGRAAGEVKIGERMMPAPAELSPSKYVVVAGFLNEGVTYVTPRCRGVLTKSENGMDLKYNQFLMYSEAEGQRGILTPFETRTFSGTLDLSDVPTGTYRLTAILEYPGSAALAQAGKTLPQNQMLVEVREEGGRKVLEVAAWDKEPPGRRGRVPIQL